MKSLLIKNIPDNVHKDFKMACLSEDKSMGQVLIELMKKYADKKK